MRQIRLVLAVLIVVSGVACAPQVEDRGEAVAKRVPVDPATRVHVSADSDARAIEIAQATVAKMGGWDAWDRTRFISYDFFGGRTHHWDRYTGDIRIEGEFGRGEPRLKRLFLMNVNSGEGRVWEDGEEVTDPEKQAELLKQGKSIWINDSYWVAMPYKLLDPGVTLKYSGERALADGRAADVLDLTFTDVGDTPQNRYEVFVAKDTGLVEQWSFFAEAADTEPRFTLPWADWKRIGEVMLSTSRGRDADWNIAVHETLDPAIFTDPAPVEHEAGGA